MKPPLSDRCRVCGPPAAFASNGVVLGRSVDYFDCPTCGDLQTQHPDGLEDAYSRTVNDVDTAIMVRDDINLGCAPGTLVGAGKLLSRSIGHAGVYGIFVVILRKFGVEARRRDKHRQKLLGRSISETNSTRTASGSNAARDAFRGVNVISNIGFGATYPMGAESKLAALPKVPLSEPLGHPPCGDRPGRQPLGRVHLLRIGKSRRAALRRDRSMLRRASSILRTIAR